jgi:hypothetical protein
VNPDQTDTDANGFGDACDPCVNPDICDDGNACTQDSCDPIQGCAFEPLFCDDGNACTIDECDPGFGCFFTSKNCDDGISCTFDSCEPATGACNAAPADSLCDDGAACTDNYCDPFAGCVAIPYASRCADGIACTDDQCAPASPLSDPATGCISYEVACEGVSCFSNAGCPETQYCLNTTGICGAPGQCAFRPGGACSMEVIPVCGCNGITYSNACVAAQAGVNVAHPGICQ